MLLASLSHLIHFIVGIRLINLKMRILDLSMTHQQLELLHQQLQLINLLAYLAYYH